MKEQLIAFILTHPDTLMRRDFILDILTPCERTVFQDDILSTKSKSVLYVGKIFSSGNGRLCQVTALDTENDRIIYDDLDDDSKYRTVSLLEIDTPITLEKGQIENYLEDAPLDTTVGRFLVNKLLCAVPFGSLIPYINAVIEGKQLDKLVYELMLKKKATVPQFTTYSTNLYYLGNIAELGVPVYTPKSMTTSPDVIKRRAELLEKYKSDLKNEDPVIMSKIEQELIALDKEALKGDPSTLFIGNKGWEIQRKKLHILGGMSEKFDESGFNWVDKSLDEGLDQENFAIAANEIRGGSYSRAMETADGGVEGKHLTRVFQEARIVEDDCGSTQYVTVYLKDYTYMEYEGRIAVIGGKLKEMSADDLRERIGTSIQIRSPLGCKAKGGYCFTCFGGKIKQIGQNVLTMSANAVAAFFLKASLKKSHGVKTNTGVITDLDEFTSKAP